MAQVNTNAQTESNTMGNGGFPLPIGDHPFMLISEEVKQSRSSSGSYLQYTCVVDAGPMHGTTFPIRFNLWNPNRQAVEIAEREFNTLRIACDMPQVNDSAELLNRRAVAIVKAKTRGKNEGEIFIADFKSVSAVPSTPGMAAPPPPPPAQHAAPAQQQTAAPQAPAAPTPPPPSMPWAQQGQR